LEGSGASRSLPGLLFRQRTTGGYAGRIKLLNDCNAADRRLVIAQVFSFITIASAGHRSGDFFCLFFICCCYTMAYEGENLKKI